MASRKGAETAEEASEAMAVGVTRARGAGKAGWEAVGVVEVAQTV